MQQLLASGRSTVALCPRQFDEPAFDLFKQRRWQCPVVAAFLVDRPDVRSRPDKAVAFGQNNPGALIVELEATLGGGRDFDSILWIGWRRMCDWQNPHRRRSVFQRGDDCQKPGRAGPYRLPHGLRDAANARDTNIETASQPWVQSAACFSVNSSALR